MQSAEIGHQWAPSAIERPAVSVIVPIYGVEAYLAQCIESLLCQTLTNIQIILVDDESPDSSGEIAEAYAAKDSRVDVIHRPNGGLGPARNSGIEIAVGEYIGFVDSDDWVDSDMFEKLYVSAKTASADICFSSLRKVTDGIVKEERAHPLAGEVLVGGNQIFKLRRSFYGALPGKQKDDPTPVSVCVAIYKRELIEKNGIRFKKMRSEDKFFNTEVCKHAGRVCVTGEIHYNYRKEGQTSITRSFSPDTIAAFEQMLEELWAFACSEDSERREECQNRVGRHVLDSLRGLILIVESSSADKADKLRYVNRICSSSVLQYANRVSWWMCPPIQAVFSYLMLHGRAKALLMLAHLRNGQGIVR